MTDVLRRLLDHKPYLVSDGGMGTSLFALGLETGGSPEQWNVDHADRIALVHQGFVDAGADIILTNTFGANAYRLKLHQMADRVAEFNEAGARVARGVADAADRPIVVAGDIGPTGELFAPLGALSMADGVAAFTAQAQALAAGGADVIWIETMSSEEEVAAAAAGAATTGLPLVCTMTFYTVGCTMLGVTPAQAAAFCQGLTPAPIAYGANCGNGPAELVNVLTGLARVAGPDDVLVAKSNCGVPDYIDGKIEYDGTPEVMARYGRMARDSGARIIGACCGATPVHLRAIVEAIEGYAPKDAPDLDAIEDALGPVAAAIRAPVVDSALRRRSRRRR